MSSSDNMPLSQLAASLMDADASPRVHDHAHHAHHDHHEQGNASQWLSVVFGFFVLVVILYFVFFALRPSFVLKQCSDSYSKSSDYDREDEIDNGRLLWASFLVSFVITIVFAIFFWLMSSFAQ